MLALLLKRRSLDIWSNFLSSIKIGLFILVFGRNSSLLSLSSEMSLSIFAFFGNGGIGKSDECSTGAIEEGKFGYKFAFFPL